MHTALYSLLGLTPEVTKSQIRKAYLLAALETHPDRKTNASEAELDAFKNMKQAYEVLYDDEKRREYDTRPPTPPLESSFPRSRPQPHRSTSERDPSSSSRQPPLSRSERTTFGPSPRHSSYPYPPSPHGSDSSDSESGDDTEHDASDSESTLSEPEEEEPPHHFRSSHYHQTHPHPHRWTDDGDFHDYVDGEEDSVGLATKEAEWAEQDRRENAKRESIREGLRNGGGSYGRTTTPGPSRPSSPVREGGRSRPSAGPRSRSYATPPYESVRTSSPHTTFHDDDEYRSPRDDRRTRSYASAEEGRRERMAGSRTRPSSPERERVELRGTRSAGFAQDPRMSRRPSYDHLPSPPMPPARPLSSNFNRSLPPSPPYSHLRPNHLSPPPPLSPQNSRSRPVASWKTLDYNNSSPKGFSGPPPSSYFPGPLPPNSRQQQQPRASTSPFPRGGPPPPQFIASPRSNSSPMPRMAVGRTRSGEMMARRR